MLLSWLAPFGDVGPAFTEDDPQPFRAVSVLDVIPDDELFTETALVSVHTFCNARTPAERAQGRRDAAETDRRIMLLQRNPLLDITLPDASVANLDWLNIITKSRLQDYGVDTIHRYVARVRLGLSYVAVA